MQAYRVPEDLETSRFHLRKVMLSDAPAIFESYAADPAVTRHLGWRPHADASETAAFVRNVEAEWDSGRGFPLVVFSRDAPATLIGMFHPHVGRFKVNFGYVLARHT